MNNLLQHYIAPLCPVRPAPKRGGFSNWSLRFRPDDSIYYRACSKVRRGVVWVEIYMSHGFWRVEITIDLHMEFCFGKYPSSGAAMDNCLMDARKIMLTFPRKKIK